ncbi:MAG TPA: hypothetical protein VME41_13805 [Stellaceae bacterium]|nr:hypothetical protein [Stellaceae bacterium]
MIAAVGAAVGFAAAFAQLWLGAGPSFDDGWTVFVRAEAPQAALVFLAAFAFIALLLTTAAVVFDLARVRFGLDDIRRPSPRDCLDAFAGTGLAQTASRILDFAAADGQASDGLVLQSRFAPAEARREVLCHHRDWLVRSQFAAALALAAVIAGLGLAQDYAHVPLYGFVMPTAKALAAIAALAFLAACGRFLVIAMTEPLIDAIMRIRLPRLETRLFQTLSRIVESEGEIVRAATMPVPISAASPVLERLALALEEGRDSLREAISRLSANAATLTQTARAIADRRPEPGQGGDAAAIAQLNQAIAGLAASLERLPSAAPPIAAGDESEPAAVGASRRRRAPRRTDLGSELRRLISEFD